MDPVQLAWDDGTMIDVPAIWLRDNCPCPECKVIATSERRKLIATEPLHLAPVSVEIDSSGVTVDWGAHVSHYSLDWYRAIQLDLQRQAIAPVRWSCDLSMPTFRYADLDETSDAERSVVVDFLTRFAQYGVALVTGVPTSPGESERFVARWAPIRELPFGRVHDVYVDPGGYNIAHTFEALPPHNDFASCEWPPSGQGLHMLVNEAEGGESVVVDGWHIADQLEPEHLEILSSFPVPFRQFDRGAETWTRAPLVRRRADGSVCHLRYSNQLMQPLDPSAPGIVGFYEAYHRLSELILREENQHRFRLEPGHLLVVHGHRILHGRTEYDPTARRHLQDVYFEFEDIVNQLFRLASPVGAGEP